MSEQQVDINGLLGSLNARVKILEESSRKQGEKIDELLALANQSRGGFWVGMGMASFLGGIAGWILSHISFKV